MKKYLFLIIVIVFTITSCEKDSICIDPITPYLVIRFMDYENQKEFKEVYIEYIQAKGKDPLVVDSNTSFTVDSLAIPLDINADFTIYEIAAKIDAISKVDDINFTYQREDVFVGRSCGYKTIFEDFKVDNYTNNWIKDIEVINTIINNDTTAAIIIFH